MRGDARYAIRCAGALLAIALLLVACAPVQPQKQLLPYGHDRRVLEAPPMPVFPSNTTATGGRDGVAAPPATA